MDWMTILTLLAKVSPKLVIIILLIILLLRVLNAIKCLLRSKMLHIYYCNKETQTIRQYEMENFVLLYKAYKALWGNSFIDIIHKEVITWQVIT